MSMSRTRRLVERHLVSDGGAHQDDPTVGRPPSGPRSALMKLLWVGIWLVYMTAPVDDLRHGGHTGAAVLAGSLGLAVFVGCYLGLVLRNTARTGSAGWIGLLLAVLVTLTLLMPPALGPPWLVLFVYVSVGFGAALPARTARVAVPLAAAALAASGLLMDTTGDLVPSLLIPALLGGFAMIGVRQMIRTTVALREARATVAHLAATEERLRLARDLHDLLGHSLSLITLKSELAGRMLPGHGEQAARQVADIERVSRQALVDVREAVSGFRRPTLEAEAAGARTALAAAGVRADLTGLGALPDDVSPEGEGALAWALREAVTNVVRHSGADTCTVSLAGTGEWLCLSVTDDGRGPDAEHGNGLTGLAERLALADGRLETGQARRHGFALRAYVPRSLLPATDRTEAAAPPV